MPLVASITAGITSLKNFLSENAGKVYYMGIGISQTKISTSAKG